MSLQSPLGVALTEEAATAVLLFQDCDGLSMCSGTVNVAALWMRAPTSSSMSSTRRFTSGTRPVGGPAAYGEVCGPAAVGTRRVVLSIPSSTRQTGPVTIWMPRPVRPSFLVEQPTNFSSSRLQEAGRVRATQGGLPCNSAPVCR